MTIETEKKALAEIATKQQMDAANPENSVWVEASAGTGKTKVLSDRVVRLLLEKVNPAKILCLTYTKAAAVEMSDRIAKRLSDWAVESDIKLEKDLKGLLGNKFNPSNAEEIKNFARTLFALQLDAPGGMKIQTIHSFCQDILKRFPLEAGISPYFEVMEDRKSKEILQDIQVELLQKAAENPNSDIARSITFLTQHISEFQFPDVMTKITENRSRINDLLRMNNNNLSLISQKLENLLKVKSSMTEADIKQQAMDGIDGAMIMRFADALAQGSKTDKDMSEILKIVVGNKFSADDFENYKSVFLKKDDLPKASGTLAHKGAVAVFAEIQEFMYLEAVRLVDYINLIKSLMVLKATIAVLTIAQSIISGYIRYKEMYAALDYEDLIVITRHLLEDESLANWVLFKLDGGVEHVLIDEAQDTSPNQWAIIKALTQEFFVGCGAYEEKLPRTVFVVGDRKQSIFSFQGADPKEFDKVYRYFKEKSEQFQKICLDVSFRSTCAVMDCVNALFRNETAKKGVVPQNEQINHSPFRLGEGGRVEIMPILFKEKKKEDDKINWTVTAQRENIVSPATQLAKQIAENIRTMVQNKVLIKNRPVRYGDFMFLVQKRAGIVEEFIRACKEINVNVSGMDRLKMLEQIAVQDLISLGKFLLLPKDNLSLAEVLKSPLFGLNDDDLFTLRYKRNGILFNSLLTDKNYEDVAEKLKKLLNSVDFMRPFELFHMVLVQMEGRKKFVERIGNEADDVLDEFLNLALVYEQEHTPTLQAFINWIEQDEVIIKKEMEQGDNDSVKIMTVHGSKGLQAPIVILADTVRIKNKSRKMSFLWHENGLPLFPTGSAYYDVHCETIKDQEMESAEDEYRRLLYVALTRAEDSLYVAGFCNNDKIADESWYGLLSDTIKSNIPLTENDKRIVYEVPNLITPTKKGENQETHFKSYDYSHVLSVAPIEDALAKPYTPSKDATDETEIVASPLEDNGKFYRRGTVIHKLLQYIISIEKENREDAAYLFVKKNLPEYSDDKLWDIVHEVITLCDNHAEIFTENSMAEVPIIGEVDGKIISAKIDRLIIKESEVIIVDYKTNRPAATCYEEVPEIYRSQLDAYKSLLKRIYPQKQIKSYLLWTNTCNLMEI